MHYSRIMPLVGGHRYFASTAVFLNEVIKLAFSLTMALYDLSSNMSASSSATSLFGDLAHSVFTGDSWKLAIPAMLYTLQNSLQYIAASNLDAGTFQRHAAEQDIERKRWLSLVLLVVGVAIVQIPPGDRTHLPTFQDLKEGHTGIHLARTVEELAMAGNAAAGQLSKRSATYEGIDEDVAAQTPQLNASIGFLAVVVACTLSGFSGVYFEKVLKDTTSNASVWVRNVQLSLDCKGRIFAGYNWVVWTAILLQAFGGVVVALVVNYADNIGKNFATSISIVLSCMAGVWFFDYQLSTTFMLGTAIVLAATYLYGIDDKPQIPPIRIADYEKTTVGRAVDVPYLDVESPNTKGMSTLRTEALTTSRPSTPTFERRNPFEKRQAKREV
ncbi:UDP-galactose transporter Gms1 [Taxawa tesnikishii (nom. ined.)]|nr:UDP-galactose transporter Gms1 [Dothideales sp. JES 119]